METQADIIDTNASADATLANLLAGADASANASMSASAEATPTGLLEGAGAKADSSANASADATPTDLQAVTDANASMSAEATLTDLRAGTDANANAETDVAATQASGIADSVSSTAGAAEAIVEYETVVIVADRTLAETFLATMPNSLIILYDSSDAVSAAKAIPHALFLVVLCNVDDSVIETGAKMCREVRIMQSLSCPNARPLGQTGGDKTSPGDRTVATPAELLATPAIPPVGTTPQPPVATQDAAPATPAESQSSVATSPQSPTDAPVDGEPSVPVTATAPTNVVRFDINDFFDYVPIPQDVFSVYIFDKIMTTVFDCCYRPKSYGLTPEYGRYLLRGIEMTGNSVASAIDAMIGEGLGNFTAEMEYTVLGKMERVVENNRAKEMIASATPVFGSSGYKPYRLVLGKLPLDTQMRGLVCVTGFTKDGICVEYTPDADAVIRTDVVPPGDAAVADDSSVARIGTVIPYSDFPNTFKFIDN
jgi:hypothetical protein